MMTHEYQLLKDLMIEYHKKAQKQLYKLDQQGSQFIKRWKSKVAYLGRKKMTILKSKLS